MAIVLVVIGFVQNLADMGVSSAVIQHQDISSEQLSSLYWLNILAGIVVFVLTVACTPLVALLFHEPRLISLMPLAAVTFLIAPLGQQFQLLLQKNLEFRVIASVEILSAAGGTTTGIAAALHGLGVFSLVAGQLMSTFLATIVFLVIGLRNWRPVLRFRLGEIERHIQFGFFQLGNQAVNFINARADQIVIGAFVGTTALGYYSMAWNLTVLPVSKINPILTRVAFPIFAQAQHDNARLKRGYMMVVWLLTTMNAPISVGLAVTAPLLVLLLYGQGWAPVAPIIQLMAPIGIIRSIINPVGSLFLARGRPELGLQWTLKVLFVQLLCVFVGARMGGLYGVVMGVLIAHVCYLFAHYPMLIRVLLGACLGEYASNTVPSVLIALWMGILVWLLGSRISDFDLESSINLGILTAAGAVIYFSLCILLQRKQIKHAMTMLYSRAN
jgi:O-antigen/teichoic acid export membrane protein